MNDDNNNNILRVVWFSKDRAFQLEQAITSFTECAEHSKSIQIHHIVLYTTTSDKHAASYIELLNRLSTSISIEFILETSFSTQICSIIESTQHHNLKYIIFAVDDLFFFSTFSIDNILDTLTNDDDIFTFVLPLHTHLTHSQTTGKSITRLPQFSKLKKDDTELNPIVRFLRSESENEYLYPFHLSGAVYRASDLFELINDMRFTENSSKCLSNPNLFEMNVCNWISREERRKKQIQMELMNASSVMYHSTVHRILVETKNENALRSQCLTSIRSRTACYSHPISAVLTINRVQNTFKTPICEPISSSSHHVAVSVDDLLAYADARTKLDILAYKKASSVFNAMHIGNFYLKPAQPVLFCKRKENGGAITTG
jgi:hypothetical protein